MSPVLIETLWNVNKLSEIGTDREVQCINRNIVECKSPFNSAGGYWNVVLIETLWNVNSAINTIASHVEFVLIETLWNVNKLSEIGTDREVQY